MPMNVMRFFIFFLLLGSFVSAQEVEVEYYNDLPRNGEVFFDALIHNIQQKNLATNDTGFRYVDSAIYYFSAKDNPCKLSSAYAVKGRLFDNRGQQDSAAFHFIKAASKISSSCEPFDWYYLYLSWGRLQERLKEYNSSDSLFQIALEPSLELDDKTYWLNVRANRANVFHKMGFIDSAIVELKSILEFANKNGIESHQYYARGNLGAYYVNLNLHDSAFVYLDQLRGLISVQEWPYIAMDMYNNLALCYYQFGDSVQAEKYYQNAIDLAQKYHRFHALQIYLENYSNLKYKIGDYQKSRDLLERYIYIQDSLFNVDKFESIKMFQAKYNIAKKNLEIERNIRNRNTLLFVLGAVLIILIAVYSRLTYTARSKKVVEREKKRSDDLLLNILPAEVAEELKETGESEARNFEEVTVLFTDFKDFTYLSEQLSAKELVGEINKFFKAFDSIVTDFGVEKIKTIGDAYMAASGLPKQSEKSALKAVKAAMAMMEKALELNAALAKEGKPLFNMRIGLHTGPVVAGIVGVKKFQYDIWGDTVNTAARMESACEPGLVNISKATFELVKNDPTLAFEMRGKVHAKGKGEMEMYYVSKANQS